MRTGKCDAEQERLECMRTPPFRSFRIRAHPHSDARSDAHSERQQSSHSELRSKTRAGPNAQPAPDARVRACALHP
eukprot:2766872-Pleurochrysis_carterae.AAC.1